MTPPAGAPERLNVRALLLGERLEHRTLARAAGGLADPIQLARPDGLVAFAFRWGAIALVGATPEQEAAVLAELRPLVSHPLPVPVEEAARIEPGATEDGVEATGLIRLCDLGLPRLAVVADALAKSAALSQQEATLAKTLDAMEPVIAGLRSRGRLAASSRPLLRLIGAALSARSQGTARIDADGKPDLLWEHPEMERLHARLATEYELRDRSGALDRKFTLVRETVGTLLSLMETRRSLGLEIAIVTFIGMDLLAALYGLIFK